MIKTHSRALCVRVHTSMFTGSSVNGSIMLTASHMPYQNNGMKFFTEEGGLAKPDITQILMGAAERAAAADVELGDDMQVRERSGGTRNSCHNLSRWPLALPFKRHPWALRGS